MFKAAATKVDDFDGTLVRSTKKDVLERAGLVLRMLDLHGLAHLRLEITMNNSMVTHKSKGGQHLASESPDESCREANEAVCFDEFIKIDAQKFHSNAEMTTEVEILRHFDDVVLFLGILGPVQLHQSRTQAKSGGKPTHFLRLSRILISTKAW